MKHEILAIVALGIGLAACDTNTNTGPGEDASFHTETEGDRQFVPLRPSAVQAVGAISSTLTTLDYSTHNGNGHGVGAYLRGDFDENAVLAYLRADDEYRRCTDRVYAVDTETLLTGYDQMVADWTPFEDAEYEDEPGSPEEHAALLRGLIAAPETEHVVASMFYDDGDDDSESCSYYQIFVYRTDGLVVSFDFDFSD